MSRTSQAHVIVIVMLMAVLVSTSCGRRRAATPQPAPDLHPEIEDGQLDHLGVGDAQVPLHERRHGHHRGRTRLFPRTGRAVHGGQLVLKRVIKQL
jgi:hypothetical protein